MHESEFSQLDETLRDEGAQAAVDKLIGILRQEGQYHRLFDALLLKKKAELGLPLVRPTSLDDVPEKKRAEFETTYIESAREIGQILLDEGQIPAAWIYFRTIQETEPIEKAIEVFDPDNDPENQADQIINIALYEGAHPVRGLELLLRANGTCNTITAADQLMRQLKPTQRRAAAALLVRQIYSELLQSLNGDIQRRVAMSPAVETVREAVTGRDWLFEEGNYHIDVSHLHATVRFARALEPSDDELQLACELCEYGRQLTEQFQYDGDPPFDDFYPAHLHYFQILLDQKREEGIDYFRQILERSEDENDQKLTAFVLVDLFLRIDQQDRALEVARQYLSDWEDPNGFSFSKLCQDTSRFDELQSAARQRDDLVTYAAAIISQATPASVG